MTTGSGRRSTLALSTIAIAMTAASAWLVPSSHAATASPGWHASYSSHYVSPYLNTSCGCAKGNPGVLTSVVALGNRQALAAGYAFPDADADSESIPVIKVWNGTRWKTWAHQPHTTQAHTYAVDDIAATSLHSVWILTAPDDSFLVGGATIRHWDGHHWSSLNDAGLPFIWTGKLLLTDGRLEAVGNDLDSGGAFVAHYGPGPNGHRWYTTHVARIGGLQAVATTSGAAFAGGGSDLERDDPGRPLIFEQDGDGWRRTTIPTSVSGPVTAIAAASGKDALAIGQSSSGTFALQWNGTNWTSSAAPPSGLQLRALVAVGKGNYWAAGVGQPGDTQTVYLHYVDGTWTSITGPDRANSVWGASQFVEVEAMTRTPGSSRLWAVGAHVPNEESCDDIDGCGDEISGSLLIDRMG